MTEDSFSPRGRMWDRLRGSVIQICRYAATLLMFATVPIWRQLHWRTIWVINAGTPSDVTAYLPERLARHAHRLPLMPAGFFFVPGFGLNLILGSALTNQQLTSDRDAGNRIVRDVQRFRATRITFNGVIPSALWQFSLWGDDARLVREQRATLWMLTENLREIAARHGQVRRVCVVGVGFTGALVANRLVKNGLEVTALDPRPEAAQRLLPEVQFFGMNADHAVRDADVVLLLSTRGDEGLATVIDAMQRGMTLLSDTHPKISRRWHAHVRARGIRLYEAALTRPGTVFLPKIPRWPRDTIPGCVGQGLVEAWVPHARDEQSFERTAREILVARLDEP